LLGAAAKAVSLLPAAFRAGAENNWLLEGPNAEDEEHARATLDPEAAAAAYARGQSVPWRDLIATLESRAGAHP
jgi:hypothetical protein